MLTEPASGEEGFFVDKSVSILAFDNEHCLFRITKMAPNVTEIQSTAGECS